MSDELTNPFPSMNPWLESHWETVHAAFLTYARDLVTEHLPRGLAALTEERIVVESLREDMSASIQPEVSVKSPLHSTGQMPPASSTSNVVLDVAEAVVCMLDDPIDRSVQIVDSTGTQRGAMPT